jgi:hypothetical protein
MSAREEWQQLLERTFGGAVPVLWLGDKRLAPSGAVQGRDIDALRGSTERFAGIGWMTRADVRAGLSALRPLLSEGGSLLLVLDESLLIGAVTRALRLAPKPDSLPLTEACEALVFMGFEEPRVLLSARPRVVLSARKPARLGALDAFFEQPTP